MLELLLLIIIIWSGLDWAGGTLGKNHVGPSKSGLLTSPGARGEGPLSLEGGSLKLKCSGPQTPKYEPECGA